MGLGSGIRGYEGFTGQCSLQYQIGCQPATWDFEGERDQGQEEGCASCFKNVKKDQQDRCNATLGRALFLTQQLVTVLITVCLQN